MTEPIELKEYEEKFTSDPKLKELDLGGLRNYLKRQKINSALNVYSNSIKADSRVGVIKYKKTTIQILPKLISPNGNEEYNNKENDNKKDKEKETILKNLIYMLSFTKKLDIKTNEVAKLSKENNPFLEILIREYANSLFECLKRLTPQRYIREENNLNYLKGKIKFPENIRYNCSNSAKFYCEYDEYSENNILNQLFLFVSTCLYYVTNNGYNKKTLKFIINYYSDIELVRFDKFKANKIKLSRNQELFKKPFMLAKMFIENATVDLTKTKIENIILLWDMNVLFEEFVFELLKRNKSEFGDWNFTAQKGKLLFFDSTAKSQNTSSQESSLRDSERGVAIQHRMTDVDIYAENTKTNEKIIIDTKYKKIETLKDISSPDVYQVSTYCLLHGATRGILLYPKWKEDKNSDYRLNTDKEFKKNINIKFKTVNLLHKDLKEELKKEDNEIIKDLKKLFEKEMKKEQ